MRKTNGTCLLAALLAASTMSMAAEKPKDKTDIKQLRNAKTYLEKKSRELDALIAEQQRKAESLERAWAKACEDYCATGMYDEKGLEYYRNNTDTTTSTGKSLYAQLTKAMETLRSGDDQSSEEKREEQEVNDGEKPKVEPSEESKTGKPEDAKSTKEDNKEDKKSLEDGGKDDFPKELLEDNTNTIGSKGKFAK